jgi:hypothetical protein
MYPGRIYINTSADVFAASIARLVDFTKDKIVAHVLGTHIEQTTPYTDYPVGTKYQPLEASLSTSRGSLPEGISPKRETGRHDVCGSRDSDKGRRDKDVPTPQIEHRRTSNRQ